MKNPTINKKIVALWNKYFSDNKDVYAPMFYDTFSSQSLLFVGMNPSFSTKGITSVLKNTEYSNIDIGSFFRWSHISKEEGLIDDCITVENYGYSNSSYYKKSRKIAEDLGVGWQHVDLFLYKETNQSKFVASLFTGSELNDFARDQIDLFEEILLKVNPRCVVVHNAKASEIFREYFKDDLVWDTKKGFHWFTRTGYKFPIFFTSMLSGQSSLDRWSCERLVWHIKQALQSN